MLFFYIIGHEVFNCMQKLSACGSVYPLCIFVTENMYQQPAIVQYGGLETDSRSRCSFAIDRHKGKR